MQRKILYIGSLVVLLFTMAAMRQITFGENKAELKFPETVTFSASIESAAEIKSIVLEYGSEQLTCGKVIAKAYPDFTAGKSANVSWAWDMRQSGSLPPGTKLWWQWVVTDANGNQTTSPRKTITWLDSLHSWQTLTGGGINLHWYDGDPAFGKTLHTTAVAALKKLDADAGLKIDQATDIYIYGETEDMRDAILFEPGWTGGMAFTPYNIVIIGINQNNIEWGKLTVAHELTHVVIGHVTFNCLSYLPTWLNEGLAMYSEGKLDNSSQRSFDQAVRDDTLMSLRALSGGFSEKADKADLSYSESFSVVKFVLETYGRNKMSALLKEMKAGGTIDNALQTVYGLDTDGLEDAWRAGIGAKARAVTGKATPTAIPTTIPTIQPVSGIPGANITPMATPVVTAAVTASPTETDKITATATPISQQTESQISTILMAIVLFGCCLGVLVVGLVAGIFVANRKNRRQDDVQA